MSRHGPKIQFWRETMAEREMTVDEVKTAAERAGLSLSEAEAAKLLKGAARERRMAEALRKHITPDLEPASVFAPEQTKD